MLKKIMLSLICLFLMIFSISCVCAENNECCVLNETSNEIILVNDDNLTVGNGENVVDNGSLDVVVHEDMFPSNSSSKFALLTYFSILKTNIAQGTSFQVILKTPNEGSVEGTILAGKTVVFNINGVSYSRTTNVNGIANLNINLNQGLHNITYSFAGDSIYSPSYGIADINVFTGNTYLSFLTNDVYKSEKFKIALFDINENFISGKTVVFNINGVSYSRTTDENGMAGLNINLNPNIYSISYSFSGDGNYLSTSGSTYIQVLLKNTILSPINTNVAQYSKYNVKLTDNTGVPISNKTLSFYINGVNYTRITDNNGVAGLNINLNLGNYPVSVYFESSSIYNSKGINNVLKVVSSGGNQINITPLNTYIVKGNSFNVKLTNNNGNVLPYQPVTIYINNIPYNRTTNAEGIASVKINLNQGAYGISITYTGTSYHAIGIYKLIFVNDDVMNEIYNSSTDYSVNSYISVNTSYQCLSNSYLINLANNIATSCSDDLEKAIAIHNYVYRLEYQLYGNGLNNAYVAGLLFKSNCYDQSNLFMALAKINGLPVRAVIGTPTILSMGHTWSQVLIDGMWVISDPTNTELFGCWNNSYGEEHFQNYQYYRGLYKDIYAVI